MKKLLITLVVLLAACSPTEEEQPLGTLVEAGEATPSFFLTDVTDTGKYTFNTEDAFPGTRAVLLYFFSATCPDCHAQTPAVVELWREVVFPSFEDDAPEGYQLICVARGGGSNSLPQAADYWQQVTGDLSLAREQMPPLYYDTLRRIYNQFAASGVPRFYVLSPAGQVTWEALTDQAPLSADQLAEKLREAHD